MRPFIATNFKGSQPLFVMWLSMIECVIRHSIQSVSHKVSQAGRERTSD